MVDSSRKWKAAGAAAFAGMFLATPAQAEYVEELDGSPALVRTEYGGAPAPQPAAQAAPSAKAEKGSRSGAVKHRKSRARSTRSSGARRAAPVRALGKNVPFDSAVDLVTPKGWTVVKNETSSVRVGWQAGEPWTAVMDRISRKAGLQARVDWNAKTVTISKGSVRSSRHSAHRAERSRASAQQYRGGQLVRPAADQPGRGYVVRNATAKRVAQSLGVEEQIFCSWNQVACSGALLIAGMSVWMQDPSGAPLPAYSAPAEPPIPVAPSRLESSAKTQELSASKSVAPAPTASAELAEPDAYASSAYRLEPGTLIAQVSRWCDQAGYQLVWKADRDVEIVSYVQYRGAFARSLQNLFKDLAKAGQPFRVSVYEANRVVEVTED